MRTLAHRIELVPDGEHLAIVLRGGLAAILTFAAGRKAPSFLHQKAVIGRFDRTGYGFFRRPETQKAPRGGFNGHTGIFWLRGPESTETCNYTMKF